MTASFFSVSRRPGWKPGGGRPWWQLRVNGEVVFDIFRRLSEEIGQSLLVVTHDPGFAAGACRIVHMEDGRILSL